LDEPAVWLYTCGNQNCHERTRVLRGRSHPRSNGRGRKLQIRQFFPLTPNSYRAYLLRDGSTPYQVLAKSSIFEVEAPVSSITTDETCYLMGDSITVSFTSADPQPFDYVGFYPRNVDLDMVTDSVMWLYLCGNQVCSGVISRGQLTFGAGGPDEGDEDSWPLNVGMYRVLLLRESGGEPYEVLSAGNTFRVVRNAARCV